MGEPGSPMFTLALGYGMRSPPAQARAEDPFKDQAMQSYPALRAGTMPGWEHRLSPHVTVPYIA